MIGVIMAGGRGSRMKSDTEKPLIRVGGKTMLARVAESLIAAGVETVVAVSGRTPKTALKAREMGLAVVKTPGDGYIEDMQFIIRKLGLDCALVVSADLPFITPSLIRDVLKKYRKVRKPVCVAVLKENYLSMGFKPSAVLKYDHKSLVPIGVNIVEKTERENHFHIISGRGALNINTPKELELTKEKPPQSRRPNRPHMFC
jgi:adenosylcobinamide-phosphate guanylyltransferase